MKFKKTVKTSCELLAEEINKKQKDYRVKAIEKDKIKIQSTHLLPVFFLQQSDAFVIHAVLSNEPYIESTDFRNGIPNDKEKTFILLVEKILQQEITIMEQRKQEESYY